MWFVWGRSDKGAPTISENSRSVFKCCHSCIWWLLPDRFFVSAHAPPKYRTLQKYLSCRQKNSGKVRGGLRFQPPRSSRTCQERGSELGLWVLEPVRGEKKKWFIVSRFVLSRWQSEWWAAKSEWTVGKMENYTIGDGCTWCRQNSAIEKGWVWSVETG